MPDRSFEIAAMRYPSLSTIFSVLLILIVVYHTKH
tara:strand:+ start:43 stop:147 length:105 start_codon:yes stop_codon:yes gene_type:complete